MSRHAETSLSVHLRLPRGRGEQADAARERRQCQVELQRRRGERHRKVGAGGGGEPRGLRLAVDERGRASSPSSSPMRQEMVRDERTQEPQSGAARVHAPEALRQLHASQRFRSARAHLSMAKGSRRVTITALYALAPCFLACLQVRSSS